jgi:hypothetical protein
MHVNASRYQLGTCKQGGKGSGFSPADIILLLTYRQPELAYDAEQAGKKAPKRSTQTVKKRSRSVANKQRIASNALAKFPAVYAYEAHRSLTGAFRPGTATIRAPGPAAGPPAAIPMICV